MNEVMLIFVTAFILQYVGHQIGDYLLQTNTQAINKGKDFSALVTHVSIYSIVVGLMMLIFFDPYVACVVYIITFIEHMIIDSRKPVLWYKNFLERKIARNKDFYIDELPFFVVISIDQAIHLVRIFAISLLIAYGVI